MYNGIQWYDYGSFGGVDGAVGPQGPQGIQGDIGPIGGAVNFELTNNGAHGHAASLTSDESLQLISGELASITKESTMRDGHTHYVVISYDTNSLDYIVQINANHVGAEHSYKNVGRGPTGPQGEGYSVNANGVLDDAKVDQIEASGANIYDVYVFLVTDDTRTATKNLNGVDTSGSLTDLARHSIEWNGTTWKDYGYFTGEQGIQGCLLYTSPSPRDAHESRMPSSA